MQYNSSFENYSSSTRDSPEKSLGKNGKGYVYKKASYQYSTSGNNNSSIKYNAPDQNIDQLDALLEDLKNERHMTREKDLLSNTKSIENYEPYGKITKNSRIVTSSHQSEHLPIENENYIVSDYSTIKTNGTLSRSDVDHQKYDDTLGSGTHYESKNKIYESSRTLNSIQPTGAVTVEDIETDLKNITLTDDILPLPGTKVTTTVRTYTYEIPAGSTSNMNTLSRNQNILYQRNELNSGLEPQPTPVKNVPQTVVYNTESYSTINRGNDQPIVSNKRYEIHENVQTTNTTRNHEVPPPIRSEYRVKTTENIRTINEPEQTYPVPVTDLPPREYNTLPPREYNTLPPREYNNLPPNYPPGSTSNRYFYKESSNVVNTVLGPSNPPNDVTNYKPPPPTVTTYTINRSPGYPPNTSNTTYKYSSSTTTNTKRGPDYPSPTTSLSPAPFPVEGSDYPLTNGRPPQRVDDLMQSFGNTDAVDKSDIETIHRKREIETAVASPNQSQVPSVNRAGKEVYYPPGHEMMLQKREEMAAASAGGGRWAKGSGMYEYESGSKSKTTTKSGGAMVPVCLPLCCAMPCSIM